jgi:hypothetical protein
MVSQFGSKKREALLQCHVCSKVNCVYHLYLRKLSSPIKMLDFKRQLIYFFARYMSPLDMKAVGEMSFTMACLNHMLVLMEERKDDVLF